MKQCAFVLVLLLGISDSADAAWLLWKHSHISRRVEGAPRGLSVEGDVDRWELMNAVDLRKECLGALKAEQKKIHDGLTSAYPGEPIAQTSVADGVSATISAGAEKKAGGASKAAQLSYEFTLWCLPAGVDPKWTRPQLEKR
jgi:hypothetical protein